MTRFWRLWFRAVRRRCPACGRGKIFRGWFTMHATCPNCGIRFEREPGFFLGAIYINYGLTAAIATVSYMVLMLGKWLPPRENLLIVLAFCVLFPMWYFRYARSLWLGFDEFIDPRKHE